LPEVPANFLGLMGVSAIGYVAGKTIRPGGPVLSQVSARRDGDWLRLSIVGRNLEAEAHLRIDGAERPESELGENRRAQDGSQRFYTRLEWSLPWLPAYGVPFNLAVVNSDGQSATTEVCALRFEIRGATSLVVGTSEVEVVVTVENATDGAPEASWTPPSGILTEVSSSKVKREGNAITARVIPGDHPGTGKLTLTDRTGQRASVPVEIRPRPTP
jgi:hypothetical protein